MHGMPISSVAPRGRPAPSVPAESRGESDALYSVIVSEEFLRLSEPLTVDALPEETILACFSCEMIAAGSVFGAVVVGVVGTGTGGTEDTLLLMVPARLAIEARGDGNGGSKGTSFFGGGVGGVVEDVVDRVDTDAVDAIDAVDLRIMDFLEAEAEVEVEVEVDADDDVVVVVTVDERVDVPDGVLLEGIGASLFLLSTGDEVTDFPLTEILDAVEAVDVTRDRGSFGGGVVALVPVVLTLVLETVDTADTRLERAWDEGVTSDLAVSKLVSPSLVVESVEAGLERLEVGRNVDVPTIVLRTVAVERADLYDAAEECVRDPSLVAAEDMTFLLATGLFGGAGGSGGLPCPSASPSRFTAGDRALCISLSI